MSKPNDVEFFEFYTAREVAEIYGVTRPTVENWLASKRLYGIKVGGDRPGRRHRGGGVWIIPVRALDYFVQPKKRNLPRSKKKEEPQVKKTWSRRPKNDTKAMRVRRAMDRFKAKKKAEEERKKKEEEERKRKEEEERQDEGDG